MVINHEVKDLDTFISRLACTEELLSSNSLLDAKDYIPYGSITRSEAERLYMVNKKHDDKVRRRHAFIEKFSTIRTYIAKDVLFETMIDLMDIFKKNTLYSEEFDYIHEHSSEIYDRYLKLKQNQSQM